MINVPLPRLLNDSGSTERAIYPMSVSINLNIIPLSYASIQLPSGESVPARSYVELFTPIGSAGIFRVRSPQNTYGDGFTTAELEHAIVEVGDYVVRTKYDSMMAAGTAMQTVFSHYRGNKWRLGSVSAMGTGQIAVQVDHVRVLEAMLSLLEQCPSCMLSFDFSTKPWTVNVVSRGTVVEAEGRLTRNVSTARIIYDDTELCTRAYYEVSTSGGGDSEPSSTWLSVDADTINTYGVVEREVSTSGSATQAEARRVVDEYLKKHKNPRLSVEISGEELSSITGESLDRFVIGKLFRLSLPDYNTTVEQVITALSWGDVYNKPYDMTVSLADEEDTAITFMHDVDAKGGSGGGGAAKAKEEKAERTREIERERDRYTWEMVKERADQTGRIIAAAGISITPDGIVEYAQDNERMLGSKFQLQSDKISLVVGGTDDNPEINAASIVAGINNDKQSTLKFNADVIDINGLIEEFGSETLGCANLNVEGLAECTNIECNDLWSYGNIGAANGVTIGSTTATWKSKNVRYCTLSTSRPFCYGSTSGISGTVTGSVVISYTDSTINYLGS